MKKNLFFTYLALLLVTFIDLPVFAQDVNPNIWPQFRGIHGSGLAPPGQTPPVDLESPEKLIWRSQLIPGASSPCIWGDRIFLTGFDKENQQLQVMCFNRLNGKQLWNQIVPAEEIEPYHASANPADATPVTDGERIYVHFGSYGLLSYDFEGNKIWSYELPVNTDKFGSGTSPILAGNRVVLLVRRLATKERYLLALDTRTGEQVWKQTLIEAGYSTPVIWGNDVVVHCEGFIGGYNINDGSRSWYVLVKTHGESTPIVYEDNLYVNAWHYLGHLDYPKINMGLDEFLVKYDVNDDARISRDEFPEDLFPVKKSGNEGMTGEVEGKHSQVWSWFDTDKDNFLDNPELQRYLDFCMAIDHGILAFKPGGKGNISNSHLLWRETENVAEVPSPLYFKDRVYVIKNGGYFSCVDAQTGRLIYKERIKGTGPFFASPMAAHDQIYICAHNGKVVVLATGDELKIISTRNFGEKILASPAVVDNKLYIRTDAFLYAFGD
jgi:outer membrane protein assembly factor BamB